MIVKLFVVLNTIIFSVLSAIHIYWAAGGKKWVDAAIPEKFKSKFFDVMNLNRVKIATIIVAIGLLVFALITHSNYFNNFLASNWTKTLTRIIGAIFLLRAIGDFNVVGLFKKKSESDFAKSDNKIYIPLCLYLGISSILITIL